MKKLGIKVYLLNTLIIVCCFSIWYFGTAFVKMELNPMNWSESSRFLVVAEGFITSIGVALLANVRIK